MYLKYCCGGSFAGNRVDPIQINSSFSLYYRGKANLDAMLTHLVRDYGMANSDVLVVTGSSAGGLSSFLHTDYIAEFVGPTVLTVAMPDAGYFLPGPDINGNEPFLATMKNVQELHNISTAAQGNAACWTSTPPALRWQCMWGSYIYPVMRSPAFILNSQYDWFQLQGILGLPADCVNDPLNACSAAQLAALQNWHVLFQQSINATRAAAPGPSARNGAFISSCIQHEEGYVDRRWSNDTIGGVSMRNAFGAWIDGRAEAPAWHIDAALWPNNPSCQAPGP